MAALIEKKGRELRESEESNSKLRVKLQVLERNLEEAAFSKQGHREELNSENDKLQSLLKQELAESELRVRHLKTELEDSREEG